MLLLKKIESSIYFKMVAYTQLTSIYLSIKCHIFCHLKINETTNHQRVGFKPLFQLLQAEFIKLGIQRD